MTDDREPLGRLVHETRLAYRAERERRIPSPWEDRDPRLRELDMRIGAAVAARAVAAEREGLAAIIPPERFRAMADWFDADDEFKVTMFPGTWPSRGHETQDDLRKFAGTLGSEEQASDGR